MKIYLVLFFLPFLAFGQDKENTVVKFPLKNGNVEYESIFEFTQAEKVLLYGASKKWIVETFKNANAVIQSEDPITGQIIGKGFSNLTIYQKENAFLGRQFDTEFTFQIDVKQNKCRIRFYDIIWVFTSGGSTLKTPLTELANKLEEVKDKEKLNSKKGNESRKQINDQFYGLIDLYKKTLFKAQNDDF